MKVKELIELLEKEDEDYEVLLSSDDLGNRYAPLGKDFELCRYIPFNDYEGYMLKDNDHSSKSVINALVFYPINLYSLNK